MIYRRKPALHMLFSFLGFLWFIVYNQSQFRAREVGTRSFLTSGVFFGPWPATCGDMLLFRSVARQYPEPPSDRSLPCVAPALVRSEIKVMSEEVVLKGNCARCETPAPVITGNHKCPVRR